MGRARRRCLSLVVALILGSPIVAHADEVRSKGTVLRGTIKKLTGKGVELAPEYGDGAIMIKWKDVEDIKSEATFQLLHGDEQAIYSPLLGMSAGQVQVRDGTVDVATIHSGLPLNGPDPSLIDRIRSSWRYWDGSFDISLSASQATVDTTGLAIAMATQRTKAPTRFLTAASYRFSRQKSKDRSTTPPTKEKRTLEDEWKGMLRGEYDLSPRFYAFGSVDGEYDGIDRLSVRAVPKLGAGYEIWQQDVTETKKNFLRAEAGGAYVYEEFFGGDKGDYFSVAFGALAQYHLPFGWIDWRLDYLPAVDDWLGDYLIRTQASLIIPAFDPISVKLTVADDYDNSPAPDTEKNSFYMLLGFTVAW